MWPLQATSNKCSIFQGTTQNRVNENVQQLHVTQVFFSPEKGDFLGKERICLCNRRTRWCFFWEFIEFVTNDGIR